DGGRLGHEVDAADDEQRRFELRGAPRHPERVGDHVGHVLDLGSLVVVGQDRRPPFGLEGQDFSREVRHARTHWWRNRRGGAVWATPRSTEGDGPLPAGGAYVTAPAEW